MIRDLSLRPAAFSIPCACCSQKSLTQKKPGYRLCFQAMLVEKVASLSWEELWDWLLSLAIPMEVTARTQRTGSYPQCPVDWFFLIFFFVSRAIYQVFFFLKICATHMFQEPWLKYHGCRIPLLPYLYIYLFIHSFIYYGKKTMPLWKPRNPTKGHLQVRELKQTDSIIWSWS